MIATEAALTIADEAIKEIQKGNPELAQILLEAFLERCKKEQAREATKYKIPFLSTNTNNEDMRLTINEIIKFMHERLF